MTKSKNFSSRVKGFFDDIGKTPFGKLSKKVGNKSLEAAGRFGNQRHMAVIRDAFALTSPLIIVGALAVLMRTFVFGGAGAGETSILAWIGYATGDTVRADGSGYIKSGTVLSDISLIGNVLFYGISRATIDKVSIFVAFTLAYLLCSNRGAEAPMVGGLIGLGGFFVSTLGKPGYFDANGLVTAIVISIICAELYSLLTKSNKLVIRMPEGVPPAVSRAFAKLLPAIIILVILVLINLPFLLFGYLTNTFPPQSIGGAAMTNFDKVTWVLADGVFSGIQSPFLSFASSVTGGLSLAVIYVFFASVLWFFGLHGTNILLGVFGPIFLPLYNANVNQGAKNIFVPSTFDAFIFMGGVGTTLSLVLAMLIFSRDKQERTLAKLEIGPGIFNINEPIVFGLPLILNLKYAIPFIFVPLILVVTTFLAYTWFDIAPIKISIPWTTPVGVGGLLATAVDWKGFVLAIFNFLVAFVIYTPFVILWSRSAKRNAMKQKSAEETTDLVGSKKVSTKGGK